MGWIAIYKDGRIVREEDGVGRPVDDGNNGLLSVAALEMNGRKVAVDLNNGVIAIDYESLGVQNGSIELVGGLWLIICDETNVIGEFRHEKRSDVDNDGNYTIEYEPLTWRPIWFTRVTMGVPAYVIGAQTTLPEGQGGHNKKKLVTIFANQMLGID